MTPEQEYNQAANDLARMRSAYDAARGAVDAGLQQIAALYPEVTTLDEAENVLAELQQAEETTRDEFLEQLTAFRATYIPVGTPGN